MAEVSAERRGAFDLIPTLQYFTIPYCRKTYCAIFLLKDETTHTVIARIQMIMTVAIMAIMELTV